MSIFPLGLSLPCGQDAPGGSWGAIAGAGSVAISPGTLGSAPPLAMAALGMRHTDAGPYPCLARWVLCCDTHLLVRSLSSPYLHSTELPGARAKKRLTYIDGHLLPWRTEKECLPLYKRLCVAAFLARCIVKKSLCHCAGVEREASTISTLEGALELTFMTGRSACCIGSRRGGVSREQRKRPQ